MSRISVLTPTARPGGIDTWRSSLARQTFTDFEALLLDEKYLERQTEVARFLSGDSRLVHLQPPAKDAHKFWNLSRSLNFGLAMARGELVVFYQDYIYLESDGLQRFWDKYQEVGDALISGVGHKGKQPDWAVNLGGKLTIFCQSGVPDVVTHPNDRPWLGTNRPDGKWFRDPRLQGRGFHPCNPIEYEGNWACVPLKIAEAIGGFDEDFDLGGFGYDNNNFAERAQLAGYQTWLDEDNECVGFAHELLFPEWSGDFKHKSDVRVNERIWRERIEAMQRGERHWRVGDLDAMKERLLVKA